ncbi:ATP-binding cassette-type vacuolar membrane transporter Hmt1 [Entomophthora muscae]|uniref:ATP-binding cassette-type vacuolar membrane transporter Hmt1 n=1 Tax=Entomophthora muscae TaxID=34485 RepID=A0ACC2RQI5_9FUNG|nr:ATP-binding cassette-type vacuolar membrane transporter Hmt1 [Entomophthora muscae]
MSSAFLWAAGLPLLFVLSLVVLATIRFGSRTGFNRKNELTETSSLLDNNSHATCSSISSSTSANNLNLPETLACPKLQLRFLIWANVFLSLAALVTDIYTRIDTQSLISSFLNSSFWIAYAIFLNLHSLSPLLKAYFIDFNRGCWISALLLDTFLSLYLASHPSKKIMFHVTIVGLQWILSLCIGMYDLYMNFFSGNFRSSLTPETQCTCFIFSASSLERYFNSRREEEQVNQFNGIQNIGRKFRQIAPFLWPETSLWLKFLLVFSLILMVLGRLVNWLVPQQYAALVVALGGDNLSPPDAVPYLEIGMFIFLRFLQGSIGLISNLQNFSWIPVGQFTTRELSIEMLKHLHSLSIRFHLNRKTGEILRVQDRGVASIVSVLTALLFNIIPTIADILIAGITLWIKIDRYIGMVVLLSTAGYIYCTVKLTDWRTRYRRECNKLDNQMEARAVDSLLNFETVKYFGAEDFEVQQYSQTVDLYQGADLQSKVASSILNTMQNVIIQLGLLACCTLAAQKVVNGHLSVSRFVEVVTYVNQLFAPLNWFGGYYRTIQKNFVDMENMLELFKAPLEICDSPDARPTRITHGEVEFDNVSFAYDPRAPILKGISFRVPAGSTVALVGPSGGGKSTILRLLFRFYDVNAGRILVDGHDIRDLRQKDLRRAIGVVPQDTVLFNEDVRYNICYGKVDATDAEIFHAAQAAQIHDRINSFPEGYKTRVGERGLRLSGGEKQRVAIARTFLKDPPIVLLDEATSALDTNTERQIQAALGSMTKNRTTLIIAHRLSTVVEADLILVLRNGEVVERGSHNTLMANPNSVYYDMWQKQLKEQPDDQKQSQKIQNNFCWMNNEISRDTDSDMDDKPNKSRYLLSSSCPSKYSSRPNPYQEAP